MEVASPLTFAPVPTGAKRGLGSCSPQLRDTPSFGNLSMEMELEDSLQRASKRRRFNGDASVESLANAFSSHASFLSSSLHNKSFFSNASQHMLKRIRDNNSPARTESVSPPQENLNRVVEEQAAVIESLKADKTNLESTLSTLKTDHERVVKENQLLRKAVTIQQERYNHVENELKVAQKYGEGADDQIKKLEQVILSLRYHLQTQQHSRNDFMGMPPNHPDVY